MDKKFYRQDAKEKEKSGGKSKISRHSWRSLQLGGSLSTNQFGILA